MKKFNLLEENSAKTVGQLSLDDAKKFNKRFRRVGGISIDVMREFLKHLPKSGVIGVYMDKKSKFLVPIHCRGWLASPRSENNSYEEDIEYEGYE